MKTRALFSFDIVINIFTMESLWTGASSDLGSEEILKIPTLIRSAPFTPLTTIEHFQIVSTGYHLALSVGCCHSWNFVMGNQSLTVNACWNIKWAWQTNQLIIDDTIGKTFRWTFKYTHQFFLNLREGMYQKRYTILRRCVYVSSIKNCIWSNLYNIASPRSDNLHSTHSNCCSFK